MRWTKHTIIGFPSGQPRAMWVTRDPGLPLRYETWLIRMNSLPGAAGTDG